MGIGIDQFMHVKETASEVILEVIRSHLYKSEHNAKSINTVI